jgi:hypothetical protein
MEEAPREMEGVSMRAIFLVKIEGESIAEIEEFLKNLHSVTAFAFYNGERIGEGPADL